MSDSGRQQRKRAPRPQVSIVIPVFNEEANIPALERRLFAVLDGLGRSYEVVFIDDGSRDRSRDMLVQVAENRKNVRVIELARNSGQHAAVFAGLAASRGEVVVTLDADLQNPPEEIPKLLAKTDEGYDVVGGWRAKRNDPAFRKLASKIVNFLIRRATGVHLHDYGCMLRAYRRPVAKRMARAPEITSFIPALANTLSGRVAEVEVAHSERAAGESKYSLLKLVRLQFDLMTGFSVLPLQTIMASGLFVAGASLLLGGALFVRRIVLAGDPILEKEQGIFTLFAILYFLVGALFIAMGFLGEYVGRIYTEVRRRPRYIVRKVWRGGSRATKSESQRVAAVRGVNSPSAHSPPPPRSDVAKEISPAPATTSVSSPPAKAGGGPAANNASTPSTTTATKG